jgi:two-component system sensor histidine kinase KdpD
VTFAVMLVVALLISSLTLRLRRRIEDAQDRELRTATLYGMTRVLASTRGEENLMRASVHHIREAFQGAAAIIRSSAEGDVQVVASEPPGFPFEPSERGVARWVLKNGRPAGAGSDTLPGARGLYLPLVGASRVMGVVGLRPTDGGGSLPDLERRHMLEALANQTALALERAELASDAESARVHAEAERHRSTLLSAVSHDLRSPLAGIVGSASSLLEDGNLPEATRQELLQSIYDESQRLNRIVTNLLDMSRIHHGALRTTLELESIEDVIGSALERMGPALRGRDLVVRIPAGLPLVPMDASLIEQVLLNLIDNAARYTPAGSPIEIDVELGDRALSVAVADRGPGLAPGSEQEVFEAFYRGRGAKEGVGIGLGLSIARGIVAAHGGTITASNRPDGGAEFRFVLPVDEPATAAPPPVPATP